MGFKHRSRMLAQRLGFDIQRYPASDPLWRISRLLEHQRVTTVLDVGANIGDYASTLRRLGYRGDIHSFEPVSGVYDQLKKTAVGDAKWHTHRYALGDVDRAMQINIAANRGASSSMLPMLERHLKSAPSSAYVGTEVVAVRRLDDVAEELGIGDRDRAYVKLDVQGYERAVLSGASEMLSRVVVGLQMELSLVPLYEGAMGWRDGFAIAEAHGLFPVGLTPGFTDPRSGELLQFDAVFARPADDQSA